MFAVTSCFPDLEKQASKMNVPVNDLKGTDGQKRLDHGFYAPVSKDWRHVVLPLSVCPSICLHKLNMKT